jgi:uncharacterized protein (TIRG00374 family)
MSIKTKKILNKFFILAVSIVFIVVFVNKFGDFSRAIETLSKGSWVFLLAIVLIQALAIFNRGAFYQSLYDFFSVKDSLKRLVLVSMASNFLNLAVPTAGLSGIAVFLSEAQRQGMTKSRSLFVNLFAYFLIYGVFFIVLLFGLFYLFFNNQLYPYQLVTAGIMFGMLILCMIILIVAIRGASKIKKLLQFLARFVNYVAKFFQKRGLIQAGHITILTEELSDCLKIIRANLWGMWVPVAHVFLWEAIDILTLYYLFLAFRYPINTGVLITTYAICVLFSLISITPNGVGIVEATMILVLSNLKVPVELAAIVVICYRLFTFWFPFVIGFFVFRNLQNERIIKLDDVAS